MAPMLSPEPALLLCSLFIIFLYKSGFIGMRELMLLSLGAVISLTDLYTWEAVWRNILGRIQEAATSLI